MFRPAEKIRRFYLVALTSIAIILISSQVLIQYIIHRNDDYSRRINIAGRQRMFSQKLSKALLAYQNNYGTPKAAAYFTEMDTTLKAWTSAQAALINGDTKRGIRAEENPAILMMFTDIAPYFANVADAVGVVLQNPNAPPEQHQVDKVMKNQVLFLPRMEAIVKRLDQDAFNGMHTIKDVELGLTIFALLVLLVEFTVIFAPAYKQLKASLNLRARFEQELIGANKELIEARRLADASNKTKTQFLANMSHEIRTPMNGIVGMTGLLQHTELNEEQREFVDIIRRSTDNLLGIINEILDFSKVEAGKMVFEEHSYSLRLLIEEVFDLLLLEAEKKGIDLVYELDPQIPNFLLFDSTRLRQVLLNLVGNAIKFTHKGSVSVKVGLNQLLDKQAALSVHIKDTGIGIAADKMALIFEPFGQADGSTTRQYGGTGLGLNISMRLIELMGGKLQVESEMGKGSDFYFDLKLKVDPDGHPSELEKNGVVLRGKTALVVDDNPENLALLQKLTEQWGMTAISASSGKDALGKASNMPQLPDVAVLDLNMPGMDGVELRKHLTALRGADKMKMVLLTSSDYAQSDKGKRFDYCLVKPVKHLVLKNALVNLFDENHAGKKVYVGSPQNTLFDGSYAKRYPLNILVAEDNTINQKIVAKIFEKLGYSIDVVGNGREAIDLMLQKSFDLVFMDISMPEMDGYEATGLIRSIKPGGQNPVIISMTANAMSSDREASLQAGMDDYISKPVTISTIVEVVRKWSERIAQNKGA